MRLFLGLFPDEESLVKIRSTVRKLDKIKRNFNFLPYEQLHLTIKFLGSEVSDFSKDHITELIQEISNELSVPEIKLGKLKYGFKGQQKPTVMFFDVYENEEIDDLVSQTHEQIKQLGLSDVIKIKDRKKFLHHITIARVKRSVSNSLVRQTRDVINQVEVPEIKFVPKDLFIVESRLTPTGTTYRKLTKFPLKELTKSD